MDSFDDGQTIGLLSLVTRFVEESNDTLAPTAPVSPPVTPPQPYVYVNYVLSVMECVLMLMAVWLFVVSWIKQRKFDKQKLLFLHCFIWAFSTKFVLFDIFISLLVLVGRVILTLLPREVYVVTIKNPPLQAFLDIIPEALFQMTFAVQNGMWYGVTEIGANLSLPNHFVCRTVVFLQIKKVDKRKTERIFWVLYTSFMLVLVIGAAILIGIVHAKHSDSFATTGFWERYTTWVPI